MNSNDNNILNNNDNKKTALIIMSGVPSSGKSTWSKNFIQKNNNNVNYVSTDSIRAEIGSGEGDQTVSAAAFGIARRRVSEALINGKSVIIDATSVNRKARRDWIKIGKQNNAYIVVVAFEVARDELIRRDQQRERHVGEQIIDHFLNKYEKPSSDEGIDKIIIK